MRPLPVALALAATLALCLALPQRRRYGVFRYSQLARQGGEEEELEPLEPEDFPNRSRHTCTTTDGLSGVCRPSNRCPPNRRRLTQGETACPGGRRRRKICCPFRRQGGDRGGTSGRRPVGGSRPGGTNGGSSRPGGSTGGGVGQGGGFHSGSFQGVRPTSPGSSGSFVGGSFGSSQTTQTTSSPISFGGFGGSRGDRGSLGVGSSGSGFAGGNPIRFGSQGSGTSTGSPIGTGASGSSNSGGGSFGKPPSGVESSRPGSVAGGSLGAGTTGVSFPGSGPSGVGSSGGSWPGRGSSGFPSSGVGSSGVSFPSGSSGTGLSGAGSFGVGSSGGNRPGGVPSGFPSSGGGSSGVSFPSSGPAETGSSSVAPPVGGSFGVGSSKGSSAGSDSSAASSSGSSGGGFSGGRFFVVGSVGAGPSGANSTEGGFAGGGFSAGGEVRPTAATHENTLDATTLPSTNLSAECGVPTPIQVWLRRKREAPQTVTPGPFIPFIVGGKNAEIGKWPWIALIGNKQSGRDPFWFCGGSLIDQQHILTAAHCLKPRAVDVTKLVVRLGEYDTSRTDDGANPQDYGVASFTNHKNFKFPVLHDDISVVKLERPVQFNDFIKPICLPSGPSGDYAGTRIDVAGWGYTEFGGETSEVLQEVSLPVVAILECQSKYEPSPTFQNQFPGGFGDTKLCAAEKEGGKDACQGDSGGPMVQKTADERYELIGVVSAGVGCGTPGFPGVYTRVSAYLDWIRQNTA